MQGWIKLHRRFLEWEWYSDINTKILFLHCLLKANYKDKRWQGIEIKKGSFITSYQQLSNETGLSIKQVRSSISKLEKTKELGRLRAGNWTHLSVCKYDTYQEKETSEGRPLGTPRADLGQQHKNKRKQEERNNNTWLADAKPEYLDICERLYLILEDHNKVTKSVNWKTHKWYNSIRLMVERDNINMSELNFALNHLNKHLSDEFCPQTYSANALRSKWIKVQNHIKRNNNTFNYSNLPKQGDYYIDKEKGIIYNLDGSISKEWEWDSKIKQVVML